MKTTAELMQRIAIHIPKMEGWCTPEKAQRMALAVLDAKNLISVELGIFGGRGVIALAMAHEFLGHGSAWGFDPWEKEAALEGDHSTEDNEWWAKVDLEEIYSGFVKQALSHKLLKYCKWARLRSENAVTLFKNESIGVIHCDGNHSEKTSCIDVKLWASKVCPGGYWFMDDIDWLTTFKAQEMLVDLGFNEIENHKQWALYQKKI
jgi:hypothetical protein